MGFRQVAVKAQTAAFLRNLLSVIDLKEGGESVQGQDQTLISCCTDAKA